MHILCFIKTVILSKSILDNFWQISGFCKKQFVLGVKKIVKNLKKPKFSIYKELRNYCEQN